MSSSEEESSSIIQKRKNINALIIRNVTLTVISGLSGGLGVIYLKEVLKVDAITLSHLSALSSITILTTVLFAGWFNDRFGRKKSFIIGSLLNSMSPLMLALTDNRFIVYPSTIVGALGSSFIAPAWEYFIGSTLDRNKRSTYIAIINTLVNIANIITPPIGAYLVYLLGGIHTLRYIFLIQSMASLAVLVYTIKTLKIDENDIKSKEKIKVYKLSETVKNIINDLRETYRVVKMYKATPLLMIVMLSAFAWSFPAPYWTLYAYLVCNTPQYMIGLLPASQSLTYSILSIPISRKGDKTSRKRLMMKLRPFYWLSAASLVIAGTIKGPWDPYIPILAWALWGIGATSAPLWRAIVTSAVPVTYLARWCSLRYFLYYIVSIPCYMVAGYVWSLDPRLPFIIALLVDMTMTFTLFPRIKEYKPYEVEPAKELKVLQKVKAS